MVIIFSEFYVIVSGMVINIGDCLVCDVMVWFEYVVVVMLLMVLCILFDGGID